MIFIDQETEESEQANCYTSNATQKVDQKACVFDLAQNLSSPLNQNRLSAAGLAVRFRPAVCVLRSGHGTGVAGQPQVFWNGELAHAVHAQRLGRHQL